MHIILHGSRGTVGGERLKKQICVCVSTLVKEGFKKNVERKFNWCSFFHTDIKNLFYSYNTHLIIVNLKALRRRDGQGHGTKTLSSL